jgi:hypothetical protein
LLTQKLGTNLAATIFATPLGLWGTWARLKGQNSCEILPQMWEIEWMEEGGKGR